MVCVPTASAAVLNVAFPPDRLPVPRTPAILSLNVTVPVTVDGATVAVKVTEAP
jgi:hypothetical protein